jgi:rubrerythrin
MSGWQWRKPAMTAQQKPEYLELLNAISLGESAAGIYLEAWANATKDEELADALRFVAARESSHGEIFCRRIAELGFELEQKADPEGAARLARYANPKISDAEKVGPERIDNGAVTKFFEETLQKVADGEYDPMTGNLMEWYINEEKDSVKRLRGVYARIRGECEMEACETDMATAGPSADAEAIMACMTAGFKGLEKSLEKLAKAVR